jgi:hypothetical protein
MTSDRDHPGAREEILERMSLDGSPFAERLASFEVKEAITAFFESRKPDFSGIRSDQLA